MVEIIFYLMKDYMVRMKLASRSSIAMFIRNREGLAEALALNGWQRANDFFKSPGF